MTRRQRGIYGTLEAAARAYGARHGVSGRKGGWLHNRDGRLIVQGWLNYGQRLLRNGTVVAIDANGQRWTPQPARRCFYKVPEIADTDQT